MKEIRIALLGIGRIGKIHFRNISQGFPNANIIAVSDLQYDEQAFKKEFGSGNNRDIFFTADPGRSNGISGCGCSSYLYAYILTC